ncbi:uncharacterized protein [Miscanthus floridulus]|uniref:uncharacterized protein n=1 Tax=Miscanthus floridulus TaxID=154761 RepID=UPI003458D65E
MVFFDEEESREVVVTLVDHCGPAVMSAGGEQEATRHAVVPASRKRTTSADVVGERAVKRPRSPRPLAASPVPSSSMVGAAERAGRFEERTGTRAATKPVPTTDLQLKEAFPGAAAVEWSRRSEAQTSVRSIHDLQSEDAPSAAPIRESWARGRSDPQTGGRRMPGLSIALTPVQEVWRPTLQRVVTSEGGSGVAAARPSLLGVLPPRGAADKAVAAASVLAAIPVSTAKVTLAAPSSAVAVEETRERELPISPGGGLHNLSLPSEPKALEGSMARTELGRPVAPHANVVVEILSDDEADTVAELVVSPRELVVAWSEAGPSGGLSEGDLEWPFPEDPSKARFVLRDSRERQLWDIFGGQGHVAVSKLTKLSVKLDSARKQAQFAWQLVEVDLQLAAEEIRKVSSRKSYFLRTEHAWTVELERRVESACHESQVRTTKAATARAKGQCAVERVTAAKQGLEAAKAHHEEIKAKLRTSLANTEAALQEALVALEPERATLERAQKALEPVFEFVALPPELDKKVKVLERDLEMSKASFSRNAEELAKSHEERRALKGNLDQIRNVAQLVVLEIF